MATDRFPDLRLPKLPGLKHDAETQRFLDPVRQKWVAATPEEWVRQHAIGWLRDIVGVPLGLMAVEKGHDRTGQTRRTDVTVVDRVGKTWMVLECKAPSVGITQATLDQVQRYAGSLGPAYVAVTNGLVLFVAASSADTYRFVSGVPIFPSPTHSTDPD